MDSSTEQELLTQLKTLGVRFLYVDSDILKSLRLSCAPTRNRFVEDEEQPGQLTEQSFWELSKKHQLDILLFYDIQTVANNLAYSIGYAAKLAPLAHQAIEIPYLTGGPDALFWYHIDFGIRLAASAWDRIALLLNLVFDLDLVGRQCTLAKVVKQLPKSIEGLQNDADYKTLKQFRDDKYRELQSRQAGEGARDETAHLVSAYTRLVSEFFEAAHQDQHGELRIKPQSQIDFLKEHHQLYLDGIVTISKLIEQYSNYERQPHD